MRTTQTLPIGEAFGLAVRLYEGGSPDEAENLTRQIVEAFPTHDAGRSLLARIYLQMYRSQDAIDALLPALPRNPTDGRMRALAARALLQCGRIDEANAKVSEAIALNPDLWDAHQTHANISFIRGDLANAIEAARRTVDLNPNSANCQGELATVLMAAGAFDEAIENCLTWAKREPNSDVPHYLLGMLVARAQFSGHMTADAASTWFKQQIKKSPRPAVRALYELFLSAFEFRAGNRSRANYLCHGAIRTIRGLASILIDSGWSAAQAREIDELIAQGSEVRPENADSLYQDGKSLARFYGEYVYSLLYDSPHGYGTTIANWHVLRRARELLNGHAGIDAVANFGCFAGAIDQRLALQFPQVRFFGVDRSAFVKGQNEIRFAAPNLRYVAADFADWLRDSDPVQNGLLMHVRTAIYVLPALMERIYRLARAKGYRHVLMLENFGINHMTSTWPAFGTNFPSYLLRNGILVHDYPRLLDKAGFASGEAHFIPMVNAHVPLRGKGSVSDLTGGWLMPDFHLICLHATATDGA